MKLSELDLTLGETVKEFNLRLKHHLELIEKQIKQTYGITTNKGTTGNESENRGQGERDRGQDLGDMDSQGSSKV